MGARFLAVFADAPLLFFGVVIGVALVFRLGVGVAREAARPDVVAPTFVTGAEPRPAASAGIGLHADPSASALPGLPGVTPNGATSAGEVGAAAKVQPLGMPTPARVAPRPRGHGRRPPR